MSQQKMSENTSETRTVSTKYSHAAIRDLDRVWNEVYQASLSVATTNSYINDLMDAIEVKTTFPHSGAPLYYGNTFTGYYFVVFKAYIGFYRVETDAILIDRVLFGKSDYMAILGF